MNIWAKKAKDNNLKNHSVLLSFIGTYIMLMDWVKISSDEGNEDKGMLKEGRSTVGRRAVGSLTVSKCLGI